MSEIEKNESQSPTSASVRIPLSPLENLSVGAIGGAVETCLQMPILTYKFCAQEGRAFPATVGGWYRGVGVQAGTVAPITALQFVVNGILQSIVRGREDANRDLTDFETISTAAGAGVISALVYSPVDLTTIQQQKLSLGPIATVRRIVADHGFINGLFRGFFATAVREAVYTAGYLGMAPVITSHLFNEESLPLFKHNHLTSGIAGACGAGILSALITHPVDTVKTVLQADIGATQWKTSADVVPALFNSSGGIANFFKGVVPRTVRICGAFFICSSLREFAIDVKTSIK